LLLGACAGRKPLPQPDTTYGQPPADRPQFIEPPARAPQYDPMADVPGDMPLPAVQQGAVEHIDCMSGKEALHARIAVEARGGQVLSFAYYSKWKPRTCSLDFERDEDGTKWRLTPDGATRVYTPEGRFLIRTRADAYLFEFERVQRQKFCGMPGEINGTMTVKRGSGKPQCSVVGILDANDEYLDELYGLKQLSRPATPSSASPAGSLRR
jgi:hypothetical protein